MSFRIRLRTSVQPRCGFTIIELLTVIAIIALLIGLILPAVASVKRKARKTSEINSVRQLGQAWQNYSTAYNDACLPGYINGVTQDAWSVQYSYQDESIVPAEVAAAYPWRLLPYMSHKIETMTQHLDTDYFNLEDPGTIMQIALEPGFGYNAFYLGGWWDPDEGDPIRARFQEDNVVARTIPQIEKSTEMIVFCSSSLMQAGTYRQYEDTISGSHYVVPPFLGQEEQWTLGSGGGGSGGPGGAATVGQDISILEVLTTTAVPIGRYNDRAALYYADGHVDSLYSGELVDPRKWIYLAPSPNDETFSHTPLPW